MKQLTFSELGKVKAIELLFEGSGYKPWESSSFTPDGKASIHSGGCTLLEGIDFDLTYFPLPNLGYKAVTIASACLTAEMAMPQILQVRLGISSKLDFPHIQKLFSGIAAAARDYGFRKLSLDLSPSYNGLSISVSVTGDSRIKMGKAASKDLICISGNIGGAYLGLRILDNERKRFESSSKAEYSPSFEKYKMLVGAYLNPSLNTHIPKMFKDAGIHPSFGYVVGEGLSDTLLKLQRDSHLGVKVYANRIPFEGGSFDLGKELGIDPVSAAMNGGQDFRLLFVIPISEAEQFRRDFQTFEIIGHLALPEAGAVLVTPDGAELPLHSQAWENISNNNTK